MEYSVKSPVAVVIFNRYEITKKLFEELKKVKPKELYIIADGPRMDRPEDKEKCEKTRKIFDNIDWECNIHKNFAECNLGCSKRPYTGFNWVFENVNEAIILEDDCIPDISFFRYCDELLEKYRDDERIMMISGNNQLNNWKRGEYSYHFSKFGGIGAWASWKRAWKYFDIEISNWKDETIKTLLKNKLNNYEFYSRKLAYDKLYNNSENTTAWDYQWGFARLMQSGLAISPSCNLICNIGFGPDATHSTTISKVINLKAQNMEFPLKHPSFVIADNEYDKKMIKKTCGGYINLLKDFIKNIILRSREN